MDNGNILAKAINDMYLDLIDLFCPSKRILKNNITNLKPSFTKVAYQQETEEYI